MYAHLTPAKIAAKKKALASPSASSTASSRYSLAEKMAAALSTQLEETKEKAKADFSMESKTDCGRIVVNYKLVRSTSEMRKVEEQHYYMQLCLDTRTNRQIKHE